MIDIQEEHREMVEIIMVARKLGYLVHVGVMDEVEENGQKTTSGGPRDFQGKIALPVPS